jgi:hypothetical protein
MNNPSALSKHLVRRDLERDPDHINQMLWKRKLYKKRVARNEVKKVRKHYFKERDEKIVAAAGDVASDSTIAIVD